MNSDSSTSADPRLVPVDDGAASHLEGMMMPDVALPSTYGVKVPLSSLEGRVVLYVYSMTARPGEALPENWDCIPGAIGCTPQARGFGNHFLEMQALRTSVFGLSTQTSDYQREARERLHLPYQLLSDSGLLLKHALQLPTFHAGGSEFYKRLTIIVEDGWIRKVFYPVFSPENNAAEVVAWLTDFPAVQT